MASYPPMRKGLLISYFITKLMGILPAKSAKPSEECQSLGPPRSLRRSRIMIGNGRVPSGLTWDPGKWGKISGRSTPFPSRYSWSPFLASVAKRQTPTAQSHGCFSWDARIATLVVIVDPFKARNGLHEGEQPAEGLTARDVVAASLLTPT
jgi:hypothetical protein